MNHFDAGCDLVVLASTRWGEAVLLNAKGVLGLEERESIIEHKGVPPHLRKGTPSARAEHSHAWGPSQASECAEK
jgi:hypothetical protein